MAADMTLHTVCHNAACVYHERVRRVRMTHLGQGVYAWSNLRCECGYDLMVTTPPAEPEFFSGIYESVVMEPPC